MVAGIWLAPIAHADPQDQPFLSFLAEHNVGGDANTAIRAAHIACAQFTDGLPTSTVEAIVARQVPAVGGDRYWIMAGARQFYCPN
ncbi:hypothetical protein AWC06_08060 [Mycobacterium fragae]|uniref:DUF732 domain-containing protein n=1 Tax=Mycobacterium fragae TaxID=1260918 RepID=A0A1X1V4I8_9MYCO|nr:hypothetical protein AWC06_08060 [Mycobacterium fragae]